MKEIIPAIDIKNRKVVRLYKGDFNKQTIFSQDPISIAEGFLKQGTDWIHIVNLDGALTSKFLEGVNFQVISRLIDFVKNWGGKIQLGGGIRDEKTFKLLSDKGVDRIIVGTLALKKVSLLKKLIRRYNETLTIALDVLDSKLKTQGWTKKSGMNLTSTFQKMQDWGANKFIITDINRDGSLKGPNFKLYNDINEYTHKNTKIIASGGISKRSDIQKVLKITDGVIIGKALYHGKISKNELKNMIKIYRKTNLAKRIVPCLDVKDGRVVKGINFSNLKDKGDPAKFAQFYNMEGADELVFLDISATIEERKMMFDVVRKVSENINIPFTVGGGIRTVSDAVKLIKAGAEKICINSAAVENPSIITKCARKLGSQAVMVAIDAKKQSNSWKVYIRSGTKPTGLNAVKWAEKVVKMGAGEILVTSIDRDGTQVGYDLPLIRLISRKINVPIIASGGAGCLEDFYKAINAGAEAVLAASLFHNNIVKINNLKRFLSYRDIKVRK